MRRFIQLTFLLLTFYGVFILGANCELWCPMGGIESLHTYVTEGNMTCSLGVTNFFILGGVLVMTLLLRRAFCSHVCPIGTISEWLNRLGRILRIPQPKVNPMVDRCLSLLKYPVLVLIVYLAWTHGELIFRTFCPSYALISRHGADITVWAYVVLVAILIGSLVVRIPFCRWLCPLAAVLNPVSKLGVMRVSRDADTCVDCGVCSRACPMQIPVDQVRSVSHARCTSCLSCIDACPKHVSCDKANDAESGATNRQSEKPLRWTPLGLRGRSWSHIMLVGVLLACIALAVAGAKLYPLPSFIKTQGVQPDVTESVELMIEGVTCRGSANRLWFFLERDDLYQLPDYVRLEAWPDPTKARVRVVFDPTQTDAEAVKAAIVEPYFNLFNDTGVNSRVMMSPFRIEGYDPLAGLGMPGLDLGAPGFELPGMNPPPAASGNVDEEGN